jgi:hypothetical protein
MSPFRLVLLCVGASSALVYHPSSLFQHRGKHLLASDADDADDDVAAAPPPPAAAADTGGGVDGKLVVQGAAISVMAAALYFISNLPAPTSGWAAK